MAARSKVSKIFYAMFHPPLANWFCFQQDSSGPRSDRGGFCDSHNGLLRDIGHDAARASLILHGGSVGQAANSIVHARAPTHAEPRTSAPPRLVAVAPRAEITFELHQDLAAAERDWRKLEATAEMSPFQTSIGSRPGSATWVR